jgi:hypothetical protein
MRVYGYATQEVRGWSERLECARRWLWV